MFPVMSDMFADIIKKAIPPEVLEMLSPEKLKEIGEQANGYAVYLKDHLDNIDNEIVSINSKLSYIVKKLEELNNERNNSNKRRGKPIGNADVQRGSTDE